MAQVAQALTAVLKRERGWIQTHRPVAGRGWRAPARRVPGAERLDLRSIGGWPVRRRPVDRTRDDARRAAGSSASSIATS